MKKKIFKSLLAIACLLGSTNVFAYDFEVNGIYYDLVSASDFTCKVVNGSEKYKGDLVIPKTINYNGKNLTVVQIATYAFSGCSNLIGITIPNTISSIGDDTFWDCSKLERIVIEDGETVLNLGYNSKGNGSDNKPLFCKCPITYLYLGRTVSYNSTYEYGNSPFKRQHKMKELIIGDLVTSIGDWAFYYCDLLTSVRIPNSVITVGKDAFGGCI